MKLPIFNYHGLSGAGILSQFEEEEKSYVLSAEAFSMQVNELLRLGYRTLDLAGVMSFLRKQESMDPRFRGDDKVSMLTFDDGLKSQGEIAASFLQQKKMKAIFFIPVELVGQKGHMDWNELKILVHHGFEIGSHGLQHIPLVGLPETELRREFEVSKHILEDKLGTAVKSFSIPRGFYKPSMREVAQKAGYEFLFTSSFDVNHLGCDFLELKRMAITPGVTLQQFSEMLEGRLGFRRTWEKMKETVRGNIPPAFYDAMAAAKRKVKLS